MTRDQALKLLRGGDKGVAKWNTHRLGGESIPELAGADLNGAHLVGANLRYAPLSDAHLAGADLRGADLRGACFLAADLDKANCTRANLSEATLSEANLSAARLSKAKLMGANLRGACLEAADLDRADLRHADLRQANLTEARLREADLTQADLHAANLRSADLTEANLVRANLAGANLAEAVLRRAAVWDTIFASDLSQTRSLDQTVHQGPSEISVQAILSFTEDLPETFLRGCGVADEEIEYFRSRLGAIRFYTCFISYSTEDEIFADKLHNSLQGAGIRCWKWNADAAWGRVLRHEIAHAIRKYEKLVLIAGKSSLTSPPVLEEIERALEQEANLYKLQQTQGPVDTDVLLPIAIDRYVFDKWEHPLKTNVLRKMTGDASGWQDPTIYDTVLKKLTASLRPRPDLKRFLL